jgi:hypothetical protein
VVRPPSRPAPPLLPVFPVARTPSTSGSTATGDLPAPGLVGPTGAPAAAGASGAPRGGLPLPTSGSSAATATASGLGAWVHLDAFADSYENHEPAPLPVAAQTDRWLDRVAPIRTHERVVHDVGGSFFGFGIGVTVSQLELVRKNTHGLELIQVVNPDGSSNIETVLGRLALGHNQRIELQGPALNTSLSPGDLPLGARFLGFGLTADVTSAMDHDALSYTVEVKLTDRSVAELALLAAPGAADVAADALATVVVGGASAAAVVADAVLGAVPVLSATLAAASLRRTVHVCHDPTASHEMRAFAVAHAVADTVRVVEPLTGTLMNAGLVGVAAVCGWVHVRHAQHAPPVGPPDAERDAGPAAGPGAGPPFTTPT